jgi:hypothetical protein
MAEIAFYPRSRVRVLVMRAKGKRSEQLAPRSCVGALVIRVGEKKASNWQEPVVSWKMPLTAASQSVALVEEGQIKFCLIHISNGGWRSLGGVGPYRGCKEMVSAISADKSTR